MNLEFVIKELRISLTKQREMDVEYGIDSSNHVSNVVECILQDYDKQKGSE